MARIARVVVPGVPHHVTQRGNRRLETFFSDATTAPISRCWASIAARPGVAVWGYCLMPNHVHLILVPARRGRAAPGAGRGAPALYAARQFPRGLARASVAGAVSFIPDGRGLAAGGGALCGAEPGARGAGETGAGLALVERAGASGRAGRRAGDGGAAAGAGRRLAGVPARRRGGGGAGGDPRRRAHRPAAGLARLRRGPRGADRPRAGPEKARPGATGWRGEES